MPRCPNCIDVAELRSAEGKVYLFLAIDRVSKFTYVELHPRADMLTGAAFLRGTVAAFPYTIHSVLTDNGITLDGQGRYGEGLHYDTLANLTAHDHLIPGPYT